MNLYSDKIEIKALSKIAIRMHQGINTVTEKIQYQEGGFPIIQSKHITQGRLDLSDARFVGALDFQKYKDKYNPQINDILICNIGTIGKSILIVEKVDFLIAWNLFLISLDDSQILSTYLKQYLDYLSNKNYFNQFLTGGTVKFINKSNIGGIKIPIPPIAEQKRIAEILDRTQSLISKRKEAIAKLDTLTQSIFLEMFGDPETNPYGWDIQAVSSYVAQFQGGKSIESESGENIVTKNRILKVSAVTQMVFRPEESKPLPDDYEPAPEHFVQNGDLLFSRANTTELVGAVAYVKETSSNILLPDKLWRFVWKEPAKVLPLFVWALFQTSVMRREIGKRATGTSGSMKNISQEKLLGIKTIVPPLPLQKEFAQRVEAVEKLKATHRASLSQLEALFASLQHRAFRGEL
jgi:type I restriction enzyme S subunit